MERREAVKKVSWILKSAFFAPTILTALQGCEDKISETSEFFVLNNEQHDLVKAIADTIIPRTATPSASDVKVNQFMDLLLNDVFDKEVKGGFLDGLNEFDKDCKSSTGNSFSELSEPEQYTYLEKVDKEIMGAAYGDTVPFYYTFKHLTITIYFSTEQGVKQNLNYMPVPGPYIGEVELKEGDKIMVGNKM